MSGNVDHSVERRALWVAYLAAVWAFAFAALHIAWAGGWYIGLDPRLARAAFERRLFLVYDLAVVLPCALGGVIVLAMVRPWGRRLPRSWVLAVATAGTVLLALRGGLAMVQAARAAASGAFVLDPMRFWDAWFCLGALLFGVATWRYERRTRIPAA